MISSDEFSDLASAYNVIPLHRTILADLLTPVSAYLTLRRPGSASFLLESAEPDEKIGRYSFIGIDPVFLLRSRGENVTITRGREVREEPGTVFDVVERYAHQYRQAPVVGHDGLKGGFVGYVGYDCVKHIEKLPLAEPDGEDEDDAILGLFGTVIRFDHRNHVVTIVVNVFTDNDRPALQQYEAGKKQLEAVELRLRNISVATTNFMCTPDSSTPRDGAEQYSAAVTRALRHIVDGDIFQVVLSRRVRVPYTGDPFPVYRALRLVNPSPYLFFLDFGETKLIGSSPEVLVRSLRGNVELLPIAGTRKRGENPAEDAALQEELLHDEKELSEHLMLVDLGRNDIGRICEYGSVSVPVFKRIEQYSHVMHLVSEVHGRLRNDKSPVDVLKACFPAGTVSGAPKVRAMELINELEPERRGVYAGAVGYIGLDGSMDTCIAIRTIVAHRGTLRIQSGAGIVAGSVPEREYDETVNKAEALMEAIRLAGNGLQYVGTR